MCSLARFPHFSCPGYYSLSLAENSRDRGYCKSKQLWLRETFWTTDWHRRRNCSCYEEWRTLEKKSKTHLLIISSVISKKVPLPALSVSWTILLSLMSIWDCLSLLVCSPPPTPNLLLNPINAVAHCERPVLPSCQIHWHHLSLLPLLFSVLLGEWMKSLFCTGKAMNTLQIFNLWLVYNSWSFCKINK